MQIDKNYIDSKIVVIGGGTGTFSVLSGLKQYTQNITAVVSMADSGGSARKERDEWGLLPSSDIRKSLIALSHISSYESLVLRKLFEYRFDKGRGITGMTFGNLFLVALSNILGSQKKAIEMAGKILGIKGRVLPVSLDRISLAADYEDGTKIIGEHFIDQPKHNGKIKIRRLYTKPQAFINSEVKNAIIDADLIIIGPGGFYTTVMANLIVKGVPEAIIESKAKKIFVMNLMTEIGQTYQFTAKNFIDEMYKFISKDCIDYVLINNAKIPDNILTKYKKFHAIPVVNDLDDSYKFTVLQAPLILKTVIKIEKGDRLRRSLIRHCPKTTAQYCLSVIS